MNRFRQISMVALIFMGLLVPLASAQTTSAGDLDVTINQPEDGENLTVDNGWTSADLTVDFDLQNTNTANWTTVSANVTVTDEDGTDTVVEDVVDNYNLTAEESISESVSVDSLGDLDLNEEWNVSVDVDGTNEETGTGYSVTEFVTFFANQSDLIGGIIAIVAVLLVFVMLGKMSDIA